MMIIVFQEDSDGGMTEIRFVPDDKNQLDAMFTVMSECQVSKKSQKMRKIL